MLTPVTGVSTESTGVTSFSLLGVPEPRVFSLLPRLKLVQAGVSKDTRTSQVRSGQSKAPNYSPYPEEDERELVIRG